MSKRGQPSAYRLQRVNNPYSATFNVAHVDAPNNAEVALFTPPGAPGVAGDPKRQSGGNVRSVAHQCDCVAGPGHWAIRLVVHSRTDVPNSHWIMSSTGAFYKELKVLTGSHRSC